MLGFNMKTLTFLEEKCWELQVRYVGIEFSLLLSAGSRKVSHRRTVINSIRWWEVVSV